MRRRSIESIPVQGSSLDECKDYRFRKHPHPPIARGGSQNGPLQIDHLSTPPSAGFPMSRRSWPQFCWVCGGGGKRLAVELDHVARTSTSQSCLTWLFTYPRHGQRTSQDRFQRLTKKKMKRLQHLYLKRCKSRCRGFGHCWSHRTRLWSQTLDIFLSQFLAMRAAGTKCLKFHGFWHFCLGQATTK